MCGIFALLNVSPKNIPNDIIEYNFNFLKNRGPEYSILKKYKEPADFILGFHRLAINGLDDNSNHPLMLDDNLYLICNGEIFNHRELIEKINCKVETNSDCEIILHLYKKYGIEHTLNLLDGEFSFILVDTKKNKTFVARDPLGVRPLFYWKHSKLPLYGFASEIKGLNLLETSTAGNIVHVEPGNYYEFSISGYDNKVWSLDSKVRYYTLGLSWNKNIEKNAMLEQIRTNLIKAVEKRVDNSERPIACLLSGGLDSSLVVSIASACLKRQNKVLETYSIGLRGSTDYKYAKMVSDFCGTNHHHYEVDEETMINSIPNVIRAIESYDTTTVRASVGNYLIGKYISENSDAKVILNGDGSDELCGGYLYFHKCPDSTEFDYECRRLLRDIHKYDALRSDRCISCHGLEPRTPFLDKNFVDSYLSYSEYIRNHNECKKPEKYLLREAFFGYLPKEVLNRKKEAFSDGVSSLTRSWFEIIQENKKHETYRQADSFNTPKTNEQICYRNIFDVWYKNYSENIPYYWMPKYVNANDASARTLDVYK